MSETPLACPMCLRVNDNLSGRFEVQADGTRWCGIFGHPVYAASFFDAPAASP